jgi:hypothetical protein
MCEARIVARMRSSAALMRKVIVERVLRPVIVGSAGNKPGARWRHSNPVHEKREAEHQLTAFLSAF